MLKRTTVINSVSARVDGYSLHNTLFKHAIDVRNSTINFTVIRGLFKKHFPLLDINGRDIILTTLVKVEGDGPTYYELMEMDTHPLPKVKRVTKERKPRLKPARLKKKK